MGEKKTVYDVVINNVHVGIVGDVEEPTIFG